MKEISPEIRALAARIERAPYEVQLRILDEIEARLTLNNQGKRLVADLRAAIVKRLI